MHHKITGVILSGGKSSRMGQNKALLKLGEERAIERVARQMKSLFSEVLLITNQPTEYKFLALPTFPDLYNNCGPLGGIHSALVHAQTSKVFIISCDMPMMTAEIIDAILNFPSIRPIVVPVTEGLVQQICGIYSKACLPVLEQMLKGKKYKVMNLLDEMGAEIIEMNKLLPNYNSNSFFNMNLPEDYQKIFKLC